MEQELHPFAKFIQILARGKTKTRSFTVEESREAMAMILRGEAKPEQIGAFLMLLRLKEETPEEIAGFTLGTRDTFDLPSDVPKVDIDWSSYAGKRRQLLGSFCRHCYWLKMASRFLCTELVGTRRAEFTRGKPCKNLAFQLPIVLIKHVIILRPVILHMFRCKFFHQNYEN